MRNQKTWLIVTIAIQILTGLAHGVSFFIEPQATNDTEKQLIDLFINYRQDMGAGYHRTMQELFTSISVCFTLLYLFGGLLNAYLLRKKLASDILKGVISIQILIYGVSFAVMLRFAFLPPIVLTGFVFIALLLSRITVPSKPEDPV
jgi:hypothetical protein